MTRQAILLAALLGVAGCDDAPTPKGPATRPADDYKPPQGPTTRDLVEGRRQAMSFKPWPISLQAPQAWTTQGVPDGSLVLINAPSPGGLLHLTVASHGTFAKASVDAMIQTRQERKTAPDGEHRLVALRTSGAATILEEQSVKGDRYIWMVNVFVSSDKGFAKYQLSFLDLGPQQFESDRAFLSPIIASLTYDATKE